MAIRPFKPKPLVITPEDTLEQRRAGRYVCTATWGSIEEAEKGKSHPYRMRNAHPMHDGRLSRLGWWGSRVVGHVGVLRIPLRLGRVTLMAAGIAGVCADPRARKQGIASVLLKDSLEASKRAGLSFSMLFGIPGFYHRFGFVPAFPGHRVLFFTDTLKDWPEMPRWRARKARPADVPRMLEEYSRLYGVVDGTLERNPRIFLRRKRDGYLILQGPKKGDWAYVIHRKAKIDDVDLLEVIEAAGRGRNWETAVLAWAAGQAAKIEKDRLSLYLPAQHPICWQMIFCNAIDRTEHASNAAAMVAVLDFASLAREMGPEWSARIADARVKVPKDGLLVRFSGDAYRWWPNRRDGRAEQLARAPRQVDAEFNDALGRLVMGYGQPDAVMQRYGVRAKEHALPVLRAIFAERQLGFSPVDFF